MSTPESKVRDPVVAWTKRQGFLHFRMSFRPGVRQGTPDDLFVSPDGVHVWVEFKAAGKEPTPLQYQRIGTLMNQKVMVFWSNDKDEAIAALQRVLNLSTLMLARQGAAN